jgi:phosphate starvation-inducible PhoH-like protein
MYLGYLFVAFIFNFRVINGAKCKNNQLEKYNYESKLSVTKMQKLYINKLQDESISLIVASGPAGTGKTMFACKKACEYLKTQEKKIIITRPLISVENEEMGFLPGNIDKKMSPWMIPLFDYFLETFTRQELGNFINKNLLEICPLAYMRGRTFKNAFVIADEMQNSTPMQMKMLLTRIGEDSRVLITGDENQSDLNKHNGLTDLINKLKKDSFICNEISLVTLDENDVSRSALVKKIINLYEN